MANTGVVNFFTRGLSLAGIGLCVYAFFVSTALQQNPKHAPYCNIDAQFNCTNYLTSKHIKGFGLVSKYLGEKSPLNQPNAFYGLGVYAAITLFSFLNYVFVTRLVVLLSVSAVAVSGYVNYISYFGLKQICPIEVAVAASSLLLLLVSLVKVNRLNAAAGGQKNKNKKKKQK
ncbi:vitamin K epoxide reductase complex subunit 1-like protein 1 isoform X1 [Diaphorina citri]|uniref:vitamin-K-epoxide reductase (warfarin-sensitive) n=1 Tax=Diaphorina citri TaxID=121845 RepID=A0A1S4EEI1_DIACI|nr:vitamin K epoxide reductase complex subunit 1-like protein 1 isoform X1 [Diaphorina citri]XP_017300504.1 vitamin K epoxide reductase complex subunit 1-like protein 1 isoform X2 [Diaphorina citri]XP_026681046.1 vitamin K epoxide reductase complex subunit 1-like protein 1 isoform X1 [Diaphorina citri]KAI5694662.1 hypothetical protein M8J75_003009 [Diaphorina citri]